MPVEDYDKLVQEVQRLYGLHNRFNEELDDAGEIEIAGLGFLPSKVLRDLEPWGYKNALEEWLQARLDDLRSVADAVLVDPVNSERFDQLVFLLRKDKVVPFVGAGLSMACGKPGWTEFLMQLAEAARVKKAATAKRLSKGEFEEVAENLLRRLGADWFDERVEAKFCSDHVPAGAVSLLPAIFKSFVITTNFDRILETVYSDAGRPFPDVGHGRQLSADFLRLADRGLSCLLKLHGDARHPGNRVLTKSEYDLAYGNPLSFEQPLPELVRYAYLRCTLLFLGCSLGPDRTLRVFDAIRSEEPRPPRHYAILERPTKASDVAKREKFLTQKSIFPIWYPPGQHEAVEALLCRAQEQVRLATVVKGGESVTVRMG